MEFNPQPGDIVVLDPLWWDEEYAGRLTMVLGEAQYEMDEDYSDRLINVADPTQPGEIIQCWPSELLPFEEP